MDMNCYFLFILAQEVFIFRYNPDRNLEEVSGMAQGECFSVV